MNKINKYLLTGIVSLSMTACANLDLNPLSEGSSENWYHDETEIEMALNDLWRPDFFPIDAIYWDDDLLNRNGSNSHFSMGDLLHTLEFLIQVHRPCNKSNSSIGQWFCDRNQ